eukprot:s682_g2.t3
MCKRCLIQLFKVLGEGTALGRRTLELTFLVANLQSGLGLLRREGTNNLIHSGEPAFLGGLLCSGSLVQKERTAAECSDGVDLTDAHNIAQIIQGAGFMALAMWLIFANNSKVAVAQKAPLEQRHAICATISTAVALFSGFFNILQLTAIDDFDLPGRENNFTLNLSRPIEWIATCPIMQLKLVVLAGSRVPSYRRFMMPLISVAVLLCGTASMFTGDALRFAWYGFGLSLACIMFYHNALQIKENSEGEESLFSGDSDFRKLSITLIVTWFPFPLWFSLSVEGFGLITDGFIIEINKESVATTSPESAAEFEHTGTTYVSSLEHTGDGRTLKKANSYLSQCTTLTAGMSHLSHEGVSVVSESQASVPDLNAIKPDVENAVGVEPCGEVISIWTCRTIGIVINGFMLSFLSATCTGVTYGFFLGYMGLDSYVMSSITALMKLPDVLLLPYGVISDCFPICGKNRKSWLLVAWTIAAAALLAMSLQLGSVNGQALLLEYSQREPIERRGHIKANMAMVCTAGGLVSSLVIGICMNSKAYLGTFDWGLSFSGLMTVCLALVICMVPVTVCCVYEPPRSSQRISSRAHIKGSWGLVQKLGRPVLVLKKALSSLLFFAFFVQFLVSLTTTAGPMVRSQWAHVKVLQQQMLR